MPVDMSRCSLADAEDLERHWGVRVALEMLREGELTVPDFLSLCEEAADAEPAATSGAD